ncbi:MAG TPA: hypothetical protein VHO70_19565 [Chitinispirillaceae bacterium]|nr:hypothetical protein [Chitinispirillaceae bacterium]
MIFGSDFDVNRVLASLVPRKIIENVGSDDLLIFCVDLSDEALDAISNADVEGDCVGDVTGDVAGETVAKFFLMEFICNNNPRTIITRNAIVENRKFFEIVLISIPIPLTISLHLLKTQPE